MSVIKDGEYNGLSQRFDKRKAVILQNVRISVNSSMVDNKKF